MDLLTDHLGHSIVNQGRNQTTFNPIFRAIKIQFRQTFTFHFKEVNLSEVNFTPYRKLKIDTEVNYIKKL